MSTSIETIQKLRKIREELAALSKEVADIIVDMHDDRMLESVEQMEKKVEKAKEIPPLSEGPMPWCNHCQSYHC